MRRGRRFRGVTSVQEERERAVLEELNIINLLVQIPLVAAFMWYSLHISKNFQAFIERRDAAWQATVKDLGNQVKRNTAAILIASKKDSGEFSRQVLAEITGDR